MTQYPSDIKEDFRKIGEALRRWQIRDSYARMSAYANACASETSERVYDAKLV
jgi:hypothetical protein